MENNKKKNNAIAIIAILLVIALAVLAGKWIVGFTNDAYSYEISDKWDGFAEEIDAQTKDFEKRAEEAKKKYEDSIKHLD